MSIKEITLHYLEKKPDSENCEVRPRQQPFAITPELEGLLQELIKAYNQKTGKSFGLFQNDTEQYPLKSWLEQYLEEKISFNSFTLESMDRLKQLFDQAELVSGGYILFAHYQVGMSEYLLIAMLNSTPAVSINDALELTDTEHLDLGRLHLAARINLSEWRNNADASRYISYIKPRGGRRLSDYFRDFIGCYESGDSGEDTKKLMQAFTEYCDAEISAPEAASEIKQKAYEFCAEAESGEGIELKELSAHLDEDEPDRFARFVNTRDYDMAPQITPEKNQLKRMIRYSGRAGGLAISFDAHLLGESVSYDATTGTLVIKDIPAGLKRQLQTQE